MCRPPFLLFSGGMPRASYGDRHCITVIHSKTHVALDFTSRIIDFFAIRDGPQHTGRQRTPTQTTDVWQTQTCTVTEKSCLAKLQRPIVNIHPNLNCLDSDFVQVGEHEQIISKEVRVSKTENLYQKGKGEDIENRSLERHSRSCHSVQGGQIWFLKHCENKKQFP